MYSCLNLGPRVLTSSTAMNTSEYDPPAIGVVDISSKKQARAACISYVVGHISV